MKARNGFLAVLGVVLVIILLVFAYSLGSRSRSLSSVASPPSQKAPHHPEATATALPTTAIAISGLFSATLTNSPSCSVDTSGLTIHLLDSESPGVYDNLSVFTEPRPGTFPATSTFIRQSDTWNSKTGTVTINSDRHSGALTLVMTSFPTNDTITLQGPFVCEQAF